MQLERDKTKELSATEKIRRFGVPKNIINIIERLGRIIDVEIVGDFCYLSLEPTFLEKIKKEVGKYGYDKDKFKQNKIRHQLINEFIESLPKEFTENFKKDFFRNINFLLRKDFPPGLIILKSKFKRFNPSDPTFTEYTTETIFSVYSRLGFDFDESGHPISKRYLFKPISKGW